MVRFSPFANRLAYDKIPPKVQQIRCKTNFEALRFAKPIASLADVLVKRMVEKSSNTGGKYIAIHLRFEEVQKRRATLVILISNFFLL